MVNDATAACPRFVCKLCHAAAQCITNYINHESEQAKEGLKQMKKHDVEEWKGKVLACRLLPQASRRVHAVDMVQKYTQALTIREVNPVLWLTRDRFVGFHMREEGLSREESVQKWEREVGNAKIQKRFANRTTMSQKGSGNADLKGQCQVKYLVSKALMRRRMQ